MLYYFRSDELAFPLFNVRLSENEIISMEACIDYLVQNTKLNDEELVNLTNSTRNELEHWRDNIRNFIMNHFKDDERPCKSKEWGYTLSEEYEEYLRIDVRILQIMEELRTLTDEYKKYIRELHQYREK